MIAPVVHTRPPSRVLPVLRTLLKFALVAYVLILGTLAWMILRSPPLGADPPSSGWHVRWIPDADGDGAADFVLATPFELGTSSSGSVRTFSSTTGRELRVIPANLNIRGRVRHDDLDDDGLPDAWWQSSSELVVVESSSGKRYEFDRDSGGLLEVLDDLDGDGWRDLLIGGYPPGARNTDRVSAVSLRSRHALWTVERPAAKSSRGSWFAWIGCVVGDVDGDGSTDVAVLSETDQVEFLSGRNGRTIGRSEAMSNPLGGALIPLGDLDGDGRPELLVHFDAGTSTAVVACMDGRVIRNLVRPNSVRQVFSPGDVDGDGLLDVAWNDDESATCVRATDGSTIGYWPGLELMRGRVDLDDDGRDDLLGVRNRNLDFDDDAPVDLWRRGRVEIISGRTLEPMRTYDADALGLPR